MRGAERRQFDPERDALYMPDSRELRSLCDAEQTAADRLAGNGDEVGAIVVWCEPDWLALTCDMLLANFGQLRALVNALTKLSELLLVEGEAAVAGGGGWWEFVDQRKGVFTWKAAPSYPRDAVGGV
ncbi:hypothetical protein MN608_01921 [Microdochium nivale]|nr:hypothetical protein MN608_01921 [Microdochium nivale]